MMDNKRRPEDRQAVAQRANHADSMRLTTRRLVASLEVATGIGLLLFWTAFFTGKPTEIKMDTLEVVESAGLAYSIGAYRYTQDSVRHEGKYTVLYRKDDSGTYRCIVDSFSDNA